MYLDTGSFALEPQDTVFIFNRWELLDSVFVEVSGNVRKPGRIPYLANMRASDAIVAAGGFKEDTYLDEVHVLKYSPDASKTTIQKVNMRSVLENYSTDENTVLAPNDKVIVFSEWNFHFRDSVSILGEVKKPGKFKLVNGMTVSDLIKQAGGYNKSSYKLYVEVVRMEVKDDSLQTENIVKLTFNEDPKERIDFKLQNRDEVYIRNIIDYEKTISIKLTGLFVFPGTYRAEKGEKLSSVILRAGGFREDAFLPGLVFTRKRVQEKQQENLKIVSEKLQKQLEKMLTEDVSLSPEDKAYRDILVRQQLSMLDKLKSATALGRVIIRVKDLSSFKGSEYDIKVEDGDEMTVRENLNTVSILGEVFAPISVIYSKNSNTVGECLELAGGVDENGDEDNIYLVKADGSVMTPKTVGFFTCFNWVEVGPGASIIVPPKVPKKSFWAELQQITSVIYNLAVSTGVVYTIFKG